MLENQFDNRPKFINVAIATDTILYAPFFMAYYGGDFADTPFGKFNVNIIGKEEDNRFLPLKLKGDGFATFCTIFGLSDVSICDPSFLSFLQNCSLDDFTKLCDSFFDILTVYGKNSIVKKNPEVFSEAKKLIPDKLKKKIEADKRIIGALISKLAFSVVGTFELNNLISTSYRNSELIGSNPLNDCTKQLFTKKEIKKFIYYNDPSTGNCLGKIYGNIYEKAEPTESLCKDFGEELVYLTNSIPKPSYAFSCDYVAIDYRKNIETDNSKKVIEIKDFVKSGEGYLFTGFVGDIKKDNENKLKGFLYCIDKNLFEIDYYLKNEEITGLVNFIKSKLPREKEMLTYILKMLVADKECFDVIKNKVKDDNDPFLLDNVIGMYANRLSEWQSYGQLDYEGLYYKSTQIDAQKRNDILNIYKLRRKAFKEGEIEELEKQKISKSISENLLSEWSIKEDEIILLNKKALDLNPSHSRRKLFYQAIKSPFSLISKKIKDETKTFIWTLLSKSTFIYWIGVSFILFEILTGIAHLTHAYLNNWPKIPIPIPNYISENGWIINWWDWNINPVINGVFIYITAIIIVTVIMGYSLIRSKQFEKYVYRHE